MARVRILLLYATTWQCAIANGDSTEGSSLEVVWGVWLACKPFWGEKGCRSNPDAHGFLHSYYCMSPHMSPFPKVWTHFKFNSMIFTQKNVLGLLLDQALVVD